MKEGFRRHRDVKKASSKAETVPLLTEHESVRHKKFMQCAKMNNRERECKKTVHTHAVNELNVFFRLFLFTEKIISLMNDFLKVRL